MDRKKKKKKDICFYLRYSRNFLKEMVIGTERDVKVSEYTLM